MSRNRAGRRGATRRMTACALSVIALVAAAGCGEKDEPDLSTVETTTPTTTVPTTTAPVPTTTTPAPAP